MMEVYNYFYLVDSYLIPIPTVMSTLVEHGEFARLWFCAECTCLWNCCGWDWQMFQAKFENQLYVTIISDSWCGPVWCFRQVWQWCLFDNQILCHPILSTLEFHNLWALALFVRYIRVRFEAGSASLLEWGGAISVHSDLGMNAIAICVIERVIRKLGHVWSMHRNFRPRPLLATPINFCYYDWQIAMLGRCLCCCC